tara:strand:+ start:886 stop:1116 length:231 start_codon:yes stop_codon:yes gene_type:complete
LQIKYIFTFFSNCILLPIGEKNLRAGLLCQTSEGEGEGEKLSGAAWDSFHFLRDFFMEKPKNLRWRNKQGALIAIV